ncbi:MAG: amidohydrolase [Clostridia bacterium]|nr:amidohydrolase [Clostridia bacterium]
MRILIKNATLISMDESREQVEKNMDILIENNTISRIAKNILIDLNSDTKIIDATNKVVMPGLINTHAHVPMSIFRETVDGYNLQDWLGKKIEPMEDQLTKEDIYYASLLSYIEMIENGCTTINDMYFMTEDSIKAMKEAGIRLQTTRTLVDVPTAESGIKRLNEFLNVIKNYKNYDEKLSFNVGIHGLYTASPEYVKKCIQVARENNLYIHMHFCENSKEVENIKNSYSKEPVDVLLEYFQDEKILLAHAVKLNDEEIEKIKDMNVSIAHCPISNLKLGCGIANIKKMIECGINVSLGTDGQGSGCNLDMFELMKYTALLQKGLHENPQLMSAYDVLKMATVNGAKALGLEDIVGCISEGKMADIIIINMDNTKVKPENNLISQIVYNVTGDNVETTIVNGNILMENRELKVDIDKQEIYKKCDEIIERISK